MFLKKDKLLIFINSKYLQILSKKLDKKLEFNDNSFKNQKIIDQAKFEEDIKSFLNENKIKNKEIIILLSQDLVLKENISSDTSKKTKEQLEKFIKGTHVSPENVSQIEYVENNTHTVYLTDNSFYAVIKRICNNLNSQTIAVFPAPVFEGLEDKSNLITEKASLLLEKCGSFDKVNYLSTISEEKEIVSEKVENQIENPQKTNKFFLAVVILAVTLLSLLTVGVFITLLKYSFTADQKQEKEIIPTPTVASSIQEATKSSSLNFVAKEKLKIKILNGSGIAGQANLLKDKLTKSGFKNIETGNSEERLKNRSLVEFSSKVPEDLCQEIQEDLDSTFSNVFSKKTEDLSVDVLIITGSQ
ncbi:MAG: LytR C-terminal domain-containing protein [Actinobacteria bacterium]|nr:LytR C-terminal domain-containing protein [Actinomycetota bacterium]